MGEGERVMKRSCALCQHEDRDNLEQTLQQGLSSPKDMDKEMKWRENTSDRHYRNHMGEYHMAANTTCVFCTTPQRAEFEEAYFSRDITSEEIATALETTESTIFHHVKHHFQPLVQKTAALEVANLAGNEIVTLQSNVEKLNGKLSELLDEGSVYEDGFVRDAVTLHKEVRESIKDLMRFQDQWGPQSDGQQINQTINILSVELANESPETWKRLKSKLQENMGL
tara:strand:- start:4347 stop:5024 length:678 start_codon:yes stop_codon:yes gene_type:complete